MALLTGSLLLIAAVAVALFLLRNQLAPLWQSALGQPTRVAATETPSPTGTPVPPTPTLIPSPSASPSPPPTTLPSPTPAPAQSATPTPTPTSASRVFKLVYRDCIPHALSLGSVKGQIFDKSGRVIAGAKVRITINDYEWQSDANPATTNPDGWYEWILEVGQRVRFVELVVDGKAAVFSPKDLEVVATSGCFQRVDFVEQ